MIMDNVKIKELKSEVRECRKELFNLKLNAAAGQVKDTSQFKKMRTKIARLLTQISSESRAQEQNAEQ